MWFSEGVILMLSRRFGIEFAPEVVKADGNVHNLARRICNAKRVLVCSRLPPYLTTYFFLAAEADYEYYIAQAPYSLTRNGATTPTEGKE